MATYGQTDNTQPDSQANFANNSTAYLPVDLEAAWGRANVLTGKLDPSTVGSPNKADVIVRGNPFADAKEVTGASASTTGQGVALDQSP